MIFKKKGYVANLEINNFENNFYYAINSIRISDFNILNNCLYTNLDNI